jgi:crotonobetainyl-CoA:carnitine CoA-transferase CaiB-like acyl-CoA transferase
MGFPAYYATYGGKEPLRSGASHSSIAPYGPSACAEGEVDFLGIQNEREWEKFCEAVLERAELAEDARFSSNSFVYSPLSRRVTSFLKARCESGCSKGFTDTRREPSRGLRGPSHRRGQTG